MDKVKLLLFEDDIIISEENLYGKLDGICDIETRANRLQNIRSKYRNQFYFYN